MILAVLYLVVLAPVQFLHSHHASEKPRQQESNLSSRGMVTVEKSTVVITDCNICSHHYSTYHLETNLFPQLLDAPCFLASFPPPATCAIFLSSETNKGPPRAELS